MQPLSLQYHADKKWRRFTSYLFAKERTTVPLTLQELPRAVPAFPITITYSGKYTLSALMGLKSNHNLFVTQEGKWRTRYIPAYLRGHPFYLAQTPEGKQVVSVDEDSGLIGEEGQPMFENDKPTEPVQQVIGFLEKLAKDKAKTDKACATLDECGLIEPWPGMGGIYRVSESALAKASGEDLTKLRDTGALKVAFGQLYSLIQLNILKKLAEQEVEPDLDMENMEDLDIDWDKIKI